MGSSESRVVKDEAGVAGDAEEDNGFGVEVSLFVHFTWISNKRH